MDTVCCAWWFVTLLGCIVVVLLAVTVVVVLLAACIVVADVDPVFSLSLRGSSCVVAAVALVLPLSLRMLDGSCGLPCNSVHIR